MKKIFSVILSLVILFTSIGFTVSSHICGGKRVKTEFGLMMSDVSCGMEISENSCSSEEYMESNCCQNQFQTIQMNEDYSQPLTEIVSPTNFIITFIVALFSILPNTTIQTIFFRDYLPPPLVRDIPVLIQSFLI